jgi:UDP-N-acetylmuramate--alanine ligase
VEKGRFYFDFIFPEGVLRDCSMSLPGRHNIENATLALAIASRLVADPQQLIAALAGFKGIKRRFDWVLSGSVVYIDDYAHHPEEIRAVVRAARELFPGRKITGVFQPHLYSRTQDLAAEFAGALDELDEAILLPLYPARELPIPGVSSLTILDRMQLGDRKLLSKDELLTRLSDGGVEVLLSLGAGDIDRLVSPIQAILEVQDSSLHKNE